MSHPLSKPKTRQLTPVFGVEVEGLPLADAAEGDGFDTLRELFEAHSALLFRDQLISDETHLALAGRFGPIEDRLADARKPDEAYTVPKVSNVDNDGKGVEDQRRDRSQCQGEKMIGSIL